MKCIHHDDMDGRSAGSIVSIYEKNKNKEDFIESDYNRDLKEIVSNFKNGEKVYFVDFSFSENTKGVLNLLIEKHCDIIWIDHHKTSIDLIKMYPEYSSIKGIRMEGISGAALTYMYFENCEFEEVPMYLKLVSDYDCWKFKFGEKTKYFKYGIDSTDYSVLGKTWEKLYVNSKYDEIMLNDIIDKGKVIYDYVKNENKEFLEKNGYESFLDEQKCFVLNVDKNSEAFGEKINEYPFVISWKYAKGIYKYSIYSSKENIDCSEIAKKYGGGGHKGASGFSSSELLVK